MISRRALLRPRLRRLLLLAQLVAREFADRRARQFVDEFHRLGQFVLAELAGKEGAQVLGRERLFAGAQLLQG